MIRRAAVLLSFLFFTSSTFAVERWILISGTVGTFHTDARVFNPSFDKDISIAATFFPTDGTGQIPGVVTVPKRQMRILNDVTTAVFSTDKLGAIRFVSDDEFEVTSRIYSIQPAGTLGQFGPGLPPTTAKTKGAVLQLKSSGGPNQSGTFRTNIGAVNPNNAPANITWTMYDRNNNRITGKTTQLAAFGVMGPTNMAAGTFADVGTADISDAWVSYSSDQAIFVYGSVVDNGTSDQTFVPAVDDKGVPPTQPPPPQPTTHEFNVEMENFSITISPAPTNITRGDTVKMNFSVRGGAHTFLLFAPNGQIVIPSSGSGSRTFTADQAGLYQYACNTPTCGEGHVEMNGSFNVGSVDETPDPRRGY